MGRQLISNNLDTVLNILFKRLNLKYNKGIHSRLQEHPDYPSFLSFQHVLKQEGVDSVALRVSIEELRRDLPKPLLVHIVTNTDLFLLVDKVDNNNVHILNEDGGIDLESIESFCKVWDGNAMIFDTDNVVPRNISFKEQVLLLFNNLKYPFVLSVVLALVIFFLVQESGSRTVHSYFFLFFSGIGLLFSVLLVIEGFDEHNPMVRKMCTSKRSKNVSCTSILNSKDASFLGILPWSDVGLIFFSFFFLLNLCFPVSISLIITSILSVLAFPYVFYSITYQKFVARTWCRLCLGVQGALFSLFIVSVSLFFSNGYNNWLAFGDLVATFLLLLALSAAYIALKPLIQASFSIKTTVTPFRTLRHDAQVMQLLFSRQQGISSASAHCLVLGNPAGECRVTLVISPVCSPCMKELKILLPILRRKENTRIEVFFLTDKEENDPVEFHLAKMLIAKYQVNTEVFFAELWEYANRFPASKFSDSSLSGVKSNKDAVTLLFGQIEWCISNKLYSTPKIFVNGRLLPAIYPVNEIDYMCM